MDIVSPARQAIHDSMHVLYARGVFNYHVGVMVHRLREHWLRATMSDSYVQRWVWPAHAKMAGKDAFSPPRAKSLYESQVFVCQASEGLSLTPALANYLEQVLCAMRIQRFANMPNDS